MNLKIQDLNFDVYQRFQGILGIIERLQLPSAALALDVGGFPGTFADLLSPLNVITLDTELCPRHGYVAGTGEFLPFPDSTFDLVISSDTLEHVPPSHRHLFLNEIIRVSKQWLIIGAPFDFPHISAAEKVVNELHSLIVHKENPWLAEHRVYGLPALKETVAHLESSRCAYSIVANSDIIFWCSMMCLQILLDLTPEGTFSKHLLQSPVNSGWTETIYPRTYAYRYIILAGKDGIRSDSLADIRTTTETIVPAEHIIDKISFIGHISREITRAIHAWYSNSEKKQIPLSAYAYIQQLENAMKHQEADLKILRHENTRLATRLQKYDDHFAVRIFRKFRNLFR